LGWGLIKIKGHSCIFYDFLFLGKCFLIGLNGYKFFIIRDNYVFISIEYGFLLP
jgi:hypothetical protein